MFVEEGFRIRFANGETIDFYADSAADKDGWMGVLADVVGIPSGVARTSWTNIVLKREQGGALPAHKQVLLESKPTISSSPFRQSVPIKGTKEPSSVPAHFRNSAIPATQISPWQRAMKRGR